MNKNFSLKPLPKKFLNTTRLPGAVSHQIGFFFFIEFEEKNYFCSGSFFLNFAWGGSGFDVEKVVYVGWPWIF